MGQEAGPGSSGCTSIPLTRIKEITEVQELARCYQVGDVFWLWSVSSDVDRQLLLDGRDDSVMRLWWLDIDRQEEAE